MRYFSSLPSAAGSINHPTRHSGECRVVAHGCAVNGPKDGNPVKPTFHIRNHLIDWIPAFAGMPVLEFCNPGTNVPALFPLVSHPINRTHLIIRDQETAIPGYQDVVGAA